MRKVFTLCMVLISSFLAFGQSKSAVSDSVLYVIDGVKYVGAPHLAKEDILEIAVYHDAADLVNKKYGADARNGVIEIRTSASYRIKTYRKLLKELSPEYKYFIENSKVGVNDVNFITGHPNADAHVYRGDESTIANQLYSLKSSDIKEVIVGIVPGSKGLKLYEVYIKFKN